MTDKQMHFATRAIHGGQHPDPLTGAVMPPIYATSTYVQSSPGVHKGYDYSRTRNPTRDALQAALCNLEGGGAAFAFASGMAASSTVLELLDAGSHIVAMHDLYGGTYRLFENVRKRSAGHEVSFVDLTRPEALEARSAPTRASSGWRRPAIPCCSWSIWRRVAAIARSKGLISVCDNTFATPFVQRPLEHGFDIVVHSTTKYLNGHSDCVGGAAIVRADSPLAERLGYLQNAVGGRVGAVRLIPDIARHQDAGAAHGAALRQRPGRCAVPREPSARSSMSSIPACTSHPQHALARRQMTGGYGGIVTAILKGTLDDTRRMLERCHLFSLAESLGGVESLIEHPAIMTHASLPAAKRAALGIGDGLIRLSVGVEDAQDLIGDLKEALG